MPSTKSKNDGCLHFFAATTVYGIFGTIIGGLLGYLLMMGIYDKPVNSIGDLFYVVSAPGAIIVGLAGGFLIGSVIGGIVFAIKRTKQLPIEAEQNTSLREWRKRKNLEVNDNDTGPKLTESQSQELIVRIRREQRRDKLKSILILVIVILLPVIIYKVLSYFF